MEEITKDDFYKFQRHNQRYSKLKKISERSRLEPGLILKDKGYQKTNIQDKNKRIIPGLPEIDVYIFEKELKDNEKNYIFHQISFGPPYWMSQKDYEYGKKHTWIFIERLFQPKDLEETTRLSKKEFLKIKRFIETHPEAEEAKEYLRKYNLEEQLRNN
ncbi:MAG: hypothetical protein QT05_C0047G0046 [archaeon GW2011_AR13]|nr:MAG: hypothetical protein QT05_C0047G0046 [archaeon GW2011_AR13]HIG94670.1 hypothetical protein [Nanoarchaeota archaeon]HIH63466.1 hypothetical protein [Nanoarchaeota archaeon]HIJ09396.1 hypothetical protein [Nanoarchaeota archaeon]HLD55599.1 hypothetical protein [Candidatus Nanoarchaeia archaeon]